MARRGATPPPGRPFVFFGCSLGSTLIVDYLSRGSREPILSTHLEDMKRMREILPDARLEIMASNRETHSPNAAQLTLREIERVMTERSDRAD